MKYQKCPCCDGSGLVSRPAYIPADQPTFTTSSTNIWPCKRCNGTGTILEPTQGQSDPRDALIEQMGRALEGCVAELMDILDSINNDKMPLDGDDFHERLKAGRKALAAYKEATKYAR